MIIHDVQKHSQDYTMIQNKVVTSELAFPESDRDSKSSLGDTSCDVSSLGNMLLDGADDGLLRLDRDW